MKRTNHPRTKESFKKRIISYYQYAVSDQMIKIPFIVSMTMIIISVIYLYFMSSSLPSVVPFYYSLPWGNERLASVEWLLLIPVSSLVLLFINVVLLFLWYKKEILFVRMLFLTNVGVIFMGFYTLIRIIYLIT